MREEAREARRGNGSPSHPFCRAFSTCAAVAPSHYSCSFPIELKKPFRGFGCRLSNFLQRDLSRSCDCFCHNARIRWFRAFSTKRNGRKVWAIGFHHEFPERDLCRNFSHGGAVFESDNSSKRNEMVGIENFIRLFERATETMKNAAELAGIWPDNLQCVLPRVPLMDHHVQAEFHRKIELLLK